MLLETRDNQWDLNHTGSPQEQLCVIYIYFFMFMFKYW